MYPNRYVLYIYFLAMVQVMQTRGLRIIFWLSLIASIGSLYYGYFGDLIVNMQTGDLRNTANALVPCNMCWYIRVFMYPIPLITLIGLIRKDPNVKYYIIWLSFIGLLLCMYKYWLEMRRLPEWSGSVICSTSGVDCAVAKPNYFGFISMAFLGGLVNIIMSCVAIGAAKKQ